MTTGAVLGLLGPKWRTQLEFPPPLGRWQIERFEVTAGTTTELELRVFPR